MTMKFRLIFVFSAILILVYSCHQASSSSEKKSNKNKSLNAKVERGRYLVETAGSCMHCHSQRDFPRFAGPIKEDTKGMGGVSYPRFGTLYSSNITPDSATGIGAWTDDEIARAIAFGIRKNGDTLFPIMPYFEYNKMCREDIYSIVAYLRTLKPIANKVPERKLKVSAGAERDFFHYSSLAEHQLPAETDQVQTGKYLVAISACRACHTPRTDDERFDTVRYFGGGDGMGKKFGFTVFSSNISPDTATGIGNWTEDAFLNKFKLYRQPQAYNYDAGKHNTLMPWEMLAKMKDEDIKAIYAYLRTVRPIANKVEKWPDQK